MYILPKVIDMGLREGQEWPSDKHRQCAQNLLLCNSEVFTRDTLTEVVQWVIAIPAERLETLTIADVIADQTRPFSFTV